MCLTNDIKDLMDINGEFSSFKRCSKFKQSPNLENDILAATSFLPKDASFAERLYCIKHNIKSPPLCKVCKARTKYGFIRKGICGYRTYCGYKCSNVDKAKTQTAQYEPKKCPICDNNVKRYGSKYTKTCSQKCAGLMAIQNNYSEEQLKLLTKKELIRQHYDLKKSLLEISNEFNIEKTVIVRHCQKHNIKVKIYGTSSLEKELCTFLRSIGISNIITNDRSILNDSQELDIVLPDHKIAFEINGDYFHGRETAPAQTDRYYHLNKSKNAEARGYRLIHIFEYEWLDNNSKIKNFIKATLNVNEHKIGARKLKIIHVDKKTEKAFLHENHLQGYVPSTTCLGLVDDSGKLYQLISFGKPRYSRTYQVELLRLAILANHDVIGGTQKLFKYYIENNNIQNIISYCDNSKFSGKIYEKLNFKLINTTKPGYVWSKGKGNCEILKRYKTQKHKLQKLLGTKFDPKISEMRNMFNCGYNRLWDCGQKVFIWGTTN